MLKKSLTLLCTRGVTEQLGCTLTEEAFIDIVAVEAIWSQTAVLYEAFSLTALLAYLIVIEYDTVVSR